MLISCTLSKPADNSQLIFDKPVEKIKIRYQSGNNDALYFVELFTKTQVFHKHFSKEEALNFIEENAGKTFKNCVQRTDKEEITLLTSKKGKVTRLVKKLEQNNTEQKQTSNIKIVNTSQKKKNYLMPEGKAVPFLVLLGVMNDEGKVISSRYDKFRQINRFLEFINDVLPELKKQKGDFSESNPVRIADFGCGKSYLTFAVHYFLTEIKNIPCQIEGLDLKEDVIDYCNKISAELNLKGLIFHKGNIADYSGKENPDIVITLHACDTATDFALKYAVERNSKVILSVPCCQHQLNQQIKNESELLSPLLKYGLIKERFSALLTDSLRGNWLEQMGYNVQMLEFIDMESTPKNLLIRAVKKQTAQNEPSPEQLNLPEIIKKLNIKPEIFN